MLQLFLRPRSHLGFCTGLQQALLRRQKTLTSGKYQPSRTSFRILSRPDCPQAKLEKVEKRPWPSAMGPSSADAQGVVDLTDSPPASTMNLGSTQPPPTATNGEDEQDEDLKLAIALSLQQQEEDQVQPPAQLQDGLEEPVAGPLPTPAITTGLLGLDRKVMEAERLARLKRKRDVSEDAAPEPVRAGVTAATRPVPAAGVVSGARISPPPFRRSSAPAKNPATSVGSAQAVSRSSIGRPPPSTPSSKESSTVSPIIFPSGSVLKTYAPGYPRDGTISFPDLIAPASSLSSCVFSSFIWDFDWLFPHFNTKTTNFLLVMHAKYPSQKAQIEADFDFVPNVKVCFPPMAGNVNCMHSKLMILFYPNRCRVVVPTANLMGFDWGVGSVMENMVWVIDLPLLEIGRIGTKTDFENSLRAFLRAQTVPLDVMAKLDLYDFKNTEDVRFVHTIGGVHELEQWRDTGHCGLGKAVTSLGLATTEPVDVDFVTSSVGSLNEEFMRSIYLACQGDDGLTEYTLRNAKKFPAKRIEGSGKALVRQDAGRDWSTRLRFYFPSYDTVKSSNGGTASAGTICFSLKWWEGAKFPRRNMQDCVSLRDGLLMHNKIIYVRFAGDSGRRCAGWTYIGSANLSESAWGRLVQDKSTKRPKLNCRNWESGIVVPLHRTTQQLVSEAEDEIRGAADLGIFASTVPIPMKWPTEPYEASEKQPWFFGRD